MITDILVSPLTAQEAHARLQAALVELDCAERSVVLLFAEFARRRLYRELNFPSLIHYATEALGLARSTAYHFIDLANRLETLPQLREAVAAGRLGWTKAAPLARVATPETEAEWVEEANRTSRRELERKIERARRRTRELGAPVAPQLAFEAGPGAAPEPDLQAMIEVRLNFTPTQHARLKALLEKAHKARKVPRGWSREEVLLAGLEALIEEDAGESSRLDSSAQSSSQPKPSPRQSSRLDSRPHWQVVVHRCEECGRASVAGPDDEPRTLSRAETERIACDAVVVQPDGTSRASIPPRLRRAVLNRNRHRCANCGATRFLEVHHRHRRADGGGHQFENLVTLCSACHQLEHGRGG